MTAADTSAKSSPRRSICSIPRVLVVAGDMSGAYDIFVAGLRETLYGNATALATRVLQVVPSTHGDRSGVIGSATMVLDHVLSPAAIDASQAGRPPRRFRRTSAGVERGAPRN